MSDPPARHGDDPHISLRLARTNAEAHLYMDLHPCDACGASDFHPRSSVVMIVHDLGSRYHGTCPSCGTEREFVFRIPEQTHAPSGDAVQYGDARPSELLDPGEWLWVADSASGQGPADPSGLSPEETTRQRYFLAVAVAAIAEVLKFVPEGADAVPDSAFVSERGHSVYAAEPGRFSKPRLEAVLGAYRDISMRFGATRVDETIPGTTSTASNVDQEESTE
ncbi:hypothetical protein AB0C34_15490 [Nocardia sp. NPDC049220]|uniref:hypothetical protein n=1 Tax=Nocardia sp. NPDC049220 TaxID=3155273 RepID=UPI0033EA26DA